MMRWMLAVLPLQGCFVLEDFTFLMHGGIHCSNVDTDTCEGADRSPHGVASNFGAPEPLQLPVDRPQPQLVNMAPRRV